MSKRKHKPAIVCDDVPLWGVEAKRLMDVVGLSLDNARSSVILQWMLHGDFRPLADAIRKGQPLSNSTLNALATMIEEDRLTAIPLWDGRPTDPTKSARDYLAALLYAELIKDTLPDAAHQEIAAILGTTVDSVKKAVTRYRK
jgi:hypothetical protein